MNMDSDSNLMCDKATKCIKNITKEVLEESKGIRPFEKETWWQNEKVHAAIQLKRTNYKIWQEVRDEKILKTIGMQRKKLKK